MARDVSDAVRDTLTSVAREALKNAGSVTPQKKKSGPLSGAKGVAAGAGLAALAPLAAKKGIDAVRDGSLPKPSATKLASKAAPTKLASKASPTKLASKAASKAGDRVGSKVKDAVSSKVDEAGGAGGMLKEAASGLLPGGGGKGEKGGMPGVGHGRRMPVQQSVDVAVPIETAYNQWTQYEDWPQFMHRVIRVTQEDEVTVSFATKIWGKTKEFVAKIETQRPDERVKWRVSRGISHTGVVTFHELAPRLTRIEVTLDVDPGSLLEKAARGMRHIKRAVRADLARYKAFIEVQELETGAWRGVIEDGEVVDPHDDSYDEERDYSDIEEIRESASAADEDEDQDQEDEDQEDEDQEDEDQRARAERFKRQAQSAEGGKMESKSRGAAAEPQGGSSSSSSGESSSSSSGESSSSSSGRSTSSSVRRRAPSKPSATRSAGASRSSGSSSKSSGNGRTSSKRSPSGSSSTRKTRTAS